MVVHGPFFVELFHISIFSISYACSLFIWLHWFFRMYFSFGNGGYSKGILVGRAIWKFDKVNSNLIRTKWVNCTDFTFVYCPWPKALNVRILFCVINWMNNWMNEETKNISYISFDENSSFETLCSLSVSWSLIVCL